MKLLFGRSTEFFLVESSDNLGTEQIGLLQWMLQAEKIESTAIEGLFVGPRREMVTPWSTNACDIAANMGVDSVTRVERFRLSLEEETPYFDQMTQALYRGLSVESLSFDSEREPLQRISDIRAYNEAEGLALSEEEVVFLEDVCKKLGRDLSDAELFGFAQINSEHCRHKIFNGTFVIDGKEMDESLFSLIKKTSRALNSDLLVSAYKDNVAFYSGPKASLFHPNEENQFSTKPIDTVLSLKAETHNFPTTVEPFSGAATGSGGEIRDRMAGGRGSVPLAGTAVYMTSYPRLGSSINEKWENQLPARKWKYQSPTEILIKASNGASDFGNKFGQPLIVGSLLTFEGMTERALYAYDRTIMLAGGVGYGLRDAAIKDKPAAGDKIVVLGGDNYRIGMAGGSVSSVASGGLKAELELSAVQRPNPEMQKRVYNAIRALVESSKNPIKLIHDHGAGGHMNCLAELVEDSGGRIDVTKLPVGDSSLSTKEILSNESQERMGLILAAEDVGLFEEICKREQAPMYVVGDATGDMELKFTEADSEPVSLPLEVLFGSAPKTILEDSEIAIVQEEVSPLVEDMLSAVEELLTLEAVACKDWLTNKVDRSVTGLVARQQCVGPLQLPLSNLGAMAIDFNGKCGTATSIGSSPVAAIVDAEKGSRLSIAEALTNIVWAPLKDGLESVVLSANWMWPAKRPGENVRLYNAVKACSDFACSLGVSIPTGKDSLSMTMNYDDGLEVRAPGTVIISASAESDDLFKTVTPDLDPIEDSQLLYINVSGEKQSHLAGSSFAQTQGLIGKSCPDVDFQNLKNFFTQTQKLIREEKILAGHDVSSGGLIVTLLEMAFAGDIGFSGNIDLPEEEALSLLFSEKPGVVIQVAKADADSIISAYSALGIEAISIGSVGGDALKVKTEKSELVEYVASLRDVWFGPSSLLDACQTNPDFAQTRFQNYSKHKLTYKAQATTPEAVCDSRKTTAAIVREKGTNGDRELAYSLYAAGFSVKDITMPDLMSGKESLEDVSFVAFPGGFSNSDVLGAARGWAGAFLHNKNAINALKKFVSRPNTLSLGVCNGCQLMGLLDLLHPELDEKPVLLDNDSGKFESAFVNVEVQETGSVMLKPLIGQKLGIWVAHGEGKFSLAKEEEVYDIPMKYSYSEYPGNPNGSKYNAAALVSKDGRHLAMMPHLERSVFGWQWPYRDNQINVDSPTPWLSAFVAAREWIENN